MTGPRSITRRAPGKLFIVGEYAVMEPGTPAVLVAVDRLVSVTASAGDTDGGVIVCSDLGPERVRLRWRGVRLTGQGPHDDHAARGPLTHVVAAVEVVAELLAERGLPAPAIDLTIGSDLHRDGAKLGLGSSGAVTVAVIAAAAARCGLELTPQARFRLAMIASARLDAAASGADLAASTWGGWIVYRAPDRAALLDLVARHGLQAALRADWPGCTVRRLAAPPELTLQVGWTGHPASTRDLVARPASQTWHNSAARRAFVTEMADCALATAHALEHHDPASVVQQIRSAHRLLAELDRTAGLGIFTDELTALCAAADTAGWAAKPSGAGGGDCGIALRHDATQKDIDSLRTRWSAAGIHRLPVRVLTDAPDSEMVSR